MGSGERSGKCEFLWDSRRSHSWMVSSTATKVCRMQNRKLHATVNCMHTATSHLVLPRSSRHHRV